MEKLFQTALSFLFLFSFGQFWASLKLSKVKPDQTLLKLQIPHRITLACILKEVHSKPLKCHTTTQNDFECDFPLLDSWLDENTALCAFYCTFEVILSDA